MSRRMHFHCNQHLRAVLLFVLPFTTTLACDTDPECDGATPWMDFNHIMLKVTWPGSSQQTEWHGSFDYETYDLLIESHQQGPDSSTTGSVATVGGRIMLSKGLDLEPGYEIDALDAPQLSMRLVMILLGRIFPEGPIQITQSREVDRTDDVGIKYATPSASGYIPAPWHLKGSVEKLASEKVGFNLRLSFSTEDRKGDHKSYAIDMQGELGMLTHAVFLDTDTVDGWRTYRLGPYMIKQTTGTIFDYGARPDETTKYRTIGDIRAFIAAENDPGFKEPGKDFTGFWKQKCSQPFGLQIMHQGDEGKYSIVFCGPGGCGDTSNIRLTFITGDNNYEVVSDDELVEIDRSGERKTYHRCTKDTNPVLRYNR
jgi:hypothetical protein